MIAPRGPRPKPLINWGTFRAVGERPQQRVGQRWAPGARLPHGAPRAPGGSGDSLYLNREPRVSAMTWAEQSSLSPE